MTHRALVYPVVLAFFDNACCWISGDDPEAREYEGDVTRYGFCSPKALVDWIYRGRMAGFFAPMDLTVTHPEVTAPGVARSWLFRPSVPDEHTPDFKPKVDRVRIGAIYFYNVSEFDQAAVPYRKRRVARFAADLR